jgi:hypothetical protein
MKTLVYQVAVGKPSKLYKHCIESVKQYCEKHGFDHHVQTTPKMMIRPDPFTSNRSTESWQKHGGFLPIYEKENAFDMMDGYDRLLIVDADIYIREDAPNILEDFTCNCAFGAVAEREMDITPAYTQKIRNYSAMQYNNLHSQKLDFKPNQLGFEFFNMGMIVINTEKFKPFLKGQTGKQFIQRSEFKDFVDGIGAWKWSTDQTLLNFFLKKYKIPTKHLSGKWNGLFSAVNNIKECHFVHFFLKDLLPKKGEDVESLMKQIDK